MKKIRKNYHPPISLKLTIYRCRDLWYWLAENPFEGKQQYPGFKRIGYIPDQYCWACEYNIIMNGDRHNDECEHCPITPCWGKSSCTSDTSCTNDNSPYIKWLRSFTRENKVKYALAIADYCDKMYKNILQKEEKAGSR